MGEGELGTSPHLLIPGPPAKVCEGREGDCQVPPTLDLLSCQQQPGQVKWSPGGQAVAEGSLGLPRVANSDLSGEGGRGYLSTSPSPLPPGHGLCCKRSLSHGGLRIQT